jgi:hypothetical protein
MLEVLKQNPDKEFRFDDKFEVKSILLELGIAGRFSQNPPNVPNGKQSQQLVSYDEHPTHFIHAILFLGNPDPKENGYIVLCLPRSKFSYAQFMEVAKIILNPTDDRILGTKFFGGSSPDN